MPELPEVETVRRGLSDSIAGKKIKTVMLRRKGLRFPFPPDFIDVLTDSTITSVGRRSKYLLINLNNDQTIIMHLGMSGRVIVHQSLPNKYEKHDHVVIVFSDKTTLVFNDARRFGMMLLCDTDKLEKHNLIANIGPEPLDKSFDGRVFHERIRYKNIDMKTALMDQRVVAGLGNIYVCESLFATGISPKKKASKLSRQKADELVPHIKRVLNAAIASGGSTLRDYVRSTGDMGYFQHKFQVYGRENEPCFVCGNKIQRTVQGGRSTFYCKTCQK